MADGTLIFNTKLDNTGLKNGMMQAETSSTGLVSAFTKSAVAANLITEAVKAAGQAVVNLTKEAVEMSAAYEQNIGGIETLFKNSAATVIADAQNAYKTAGVSANEYMENVTSFAASLISSLGGNTAEAAKLANTAMIDMSDNANKMGTSMESITNAYQGFAKQNYTMLDNLKLGYGGTKEEMQRLLEKANELNAQQGRATQYSINSFSDIVEAIHVVQNELGITGTTAEEAATTITGSINAAKAAWENFLVGVTSPEETAAAFSTALENIVLGEYGLTSLFPRLMEGLGQLVSELAPRLPDILAGLADSLYKGFVGLMEGAGKSLETLIPSAVTSITKLIVTALENSEGVVEAGIAIAKGIIIGLIRAIPELVAAIPEIIVALCEAIIEAIPELLIATGEAIYQIGESIVESGADLAEKVEPAVEKIKNSFDFNMKDLPTMFAEYAGKSVANFIDSVNSIGPLSKSAFEALEEVVVSFSTLYQKAGATTGKSLANGIIDSIKILPQNMKTYASNMVNAWYDTTTPFPKRMQEIMINMKSLAEAAVKDLPNHCVVYAKNVANAWTDNLSSLPTEMGNLMKTMADSMVNNSKTLTPQMKQIISDTVDGMNEKLANISTTMSAKITDMVNGMATAASGLATTMSGKVSDMVTGMENAASSLATNMSSKISSMVTGMENAASNLATSMSSKISSMVTSMENAASSLATDMSNKITGMVQSMETAASNIGSTMSTYISTMVDNMETAILELPGKMVDGINSAITSMETALSNAITQMQTAGQNLVEGIWDGVNSKIDRFKNSVVSTFEQVVQAFKDVFGIRSPSRVMRKIGEYCVEGFEQGFETLDPKFMNNTIQASLSNIDANLQGGAYASSMNAAGGVNYTQIVNVNREIATPDELARTLRIESKYGLMKGVAVG